MADVELAAAVVVYKGCILVVRRSDSEKLAPGVWGVPCGKLDKNEHASDAVLRELREETGLKGEIVSLAGGREFISEWRGRPIINHQWNYVVQPEIDPADTDNRDMPRVRLPKRDQDSMWVPADKIDSVVGLDKHNRETIHQGLEALKAESRI